MTLPIPVLISSITRSIASRSASSQAVAVVAVGLDRRVDAHPLAASRSFTTKLSCMSGSPPLTVKPPDMILRPTPVLLQLFGRLCNRDRECRSLIVHVSGLWQ